MDVAIMVVETVVMAYGEDRECDKKNMTMTELKFGC